MRTVLEPSSRVLTLLLVVVLLLAGCGEDGEPAGADIPPGDGGVDDGGEGDADSIFAGQTLEIVVPYSPGGGSDNIARYVADYLTEHVPGNPAVQVTNPTGAAGITGSNEYERQYDHDGTALLLIAPSNLTAWILGNPAVEYDLAEMQPLIGFPSSRIFYAHADTGVEEPADLWDADVELFKGGTDPTGAQVTEVLAMEALGLREQVNEIWGYEGFSEILLGVESGELNLSAETTLAYYGGSGAAALAEDGVINTLFTLGVPDGAGGLDPDPAAPDLPTVWDVHEDVHGSGPSGAAWDAFYAAHSVMSQMSFAIVVHGDAPPEAIEVLEAGIAGAMDDPEFASGAEDLIGVYEPLTGANLGPVVDALQAIDVDTVQWVRDFLAENYEADF